MMKMVQWSKVPMGGIAIFNDKLVQKRILPMTNVLVTRSKATGGVYALRQQDTVPVLIGNYQWVEVV